MISRRRRVLLLVELLDARKQWGVGGQGQEGGKESWRGERW